MERKDASLREKEMKLVYSLNFICFTRSIISILNRYLFKSHDLTYCGALLGAHYRQARLICENVRVWVEISLATDFTR